MGKLHVNSMQWCRMVDNLIFHRADFPTHFQEVCTQIWATLYDYPGLKSCDGLIKYIKECVRTAWGLTNQVKLVCQQQILTIKGEIGSGKAIISPSLRFDLYKCHIGCWRLFSIALYVQSEKKEGVVVAR